MQIVFPNSFTSITSYQLLHSYSFMPTAMFQKNVSHVRGMFAMISFFVRDINNEINCLVKIIHVF